MTVCTVNTVSFEGLNVHPVQVQVQVTDGLPAFVVVGLGDKAVSESRERIRGAMNTLGIGLPAKRVSVNLSPANLPKTGSHFDLPIAVALLACLEVVAPESTLSLCVLGELGLDGTIQSVSGILPAAIHASEHRWGLLCPGGQGAEARWASQDLDVVAAPNLQGLVGHLNGIAPLPLSAPSPIPARAPRISSEFSDIRGQEVGKRVLLIAAAGGHNLLMLGPPGSGKSMLARCLVDLLPPLTADEALTVAMIRSLSGHGVDNENLMDIRPPYRDPHHNVSMPALIGGGNRALPGEVSLAHNGVLFLDELPEFPPTTLNALRQPLETGSVTIARANAHVRYPAAFQLVAAMNPCRCGYLFETARACRQAPFCGEKYASRISGPIMDRIDMTLRIPSVRARDLMDTDTPSAGTAETTERVAEARRFAAERTKRMTGVQEDNAASVNARQGNSIEQACALNDSARSMLAQAMETMGLSARGYYRVLRVGRTIADLEGRPQVSEEHLLEALSYRPRHVTAPSV